MSRLAKTDARWALTAWLWLAGVACASEPDEVAHDLQVPADNSGYATEPIALRAGDVERYLTVMRELRRVGLTGTQERDSTPMTWAARPEAAHVLAENEFDVPGFRRVAWSIMLAMAADDPGRTGGADSLAARATGTGDGTTPRRSEAIRSQPAGNVELVRRYRADILALHR